MVVCLVPSAGPIPKLIVARDDGTVLRYDLRDKAKVPSLFADAADPSGASVAAVTPVKVGETAPIGPFAFGLQSAASPWKPWTAVAGMKAGATRSQCSTSSTVWTSQYGVDETVSPTDFNRTTLTYELHTSDGDRLNFDGNIIKPARDALADSNL